MAPEAQKPVFVLPSNSRKAINLALEGRWQEAVAANLAIIENVPSDIDAYNRLGRAYMELGEYAAARASYSRAYEIDPYNSIAEKNLRRLSQLGEGLTHKIPSSSRLDPEHFIEEPGKAGIIAIQQEAPRETWAGIAAGEKVNLVVDGSNLRVDDIHGQYLGVVDPRIGQRLIRLIKGGNIYSAKVISATGPKAVIIREVYQHHSQQGIISFPSRSGDRVDRYAAEQLTGLKTNLAASSEEYYDSDEPEEWVDTSEDTYEQEDTD